MDIKTLELYLMDKAGELSVQESLTRIKEIDDYFSLGIDPPWATVAAENALVLLFYKTSILSEMFLENYRKILCMNLLDRCKAFSLYPKLKFEFHEVK